MDERMTALAAIMARSTGATAAVEKFARLSGGANMESSAFDYAGQGYVLRRAPSAEMMAGRPYGHDVEAALVSAAFAAGVLAPEVVATLLPEDGLGSGYIMRRVEAEVNPVKILADPPPSLVADMARELARIHAITPRDDLPLPTLDAATSLRDMRARFEGYGGDRPILALAFKWCEDHVPAPVPPVLVHGDFRMGNVMMTGDGLAAVLDWEMAHWGDSHEDLAYGCINAWRFGHIDRPAFGASDIETYLSAYEAASGSQVDRDRFRFWLVSRTLWWALTCLQMGEIWRSGMDRMIERAVIGRRTSEVEVDLLLLLEEDAPETQRLRVRLDPAPVPSGHGEPSTAEMLHALKEWVEADVKPGREGHSKFMAAVALNAIGMLIREAEHPVQASDRALADDLITGRQTLATPGLLARLRTRALIKLANDSPKYSALAKARSLWCA
jgi:aminoglycoside phosphotransferase (APT) family kinase protein